MRPLHILAVDDDPLIGLTISAFAGRLGHQCVHVSGGEQAIACYQENNFDLVLVDRIMPGLDGLQTTQHLRELQEQQGWRPIIMLSGASNIDEQVVALNAGYDDFLAKPINFSILEAKINSFWRIADMQQQIAKQHLELQHCANLEAEEKRISNFLMERLVRREQLDNPLIQHHLQPASVVSGDLLLVCTSRSNDTYVMLADATGHGLPAALTLIPLSQTFYAMAAKGFQLSSIMHELNQQHRAHSPSDRFVAALAACYRPREGILEVWNGGIPTALLLSSQGQVLWRFRSQNLPLGIVDGELFSREVKAFKLPEESAQLFMYSDGLVEATNVAGEAFGNQRLQDILQHTPPESRLNNLQSSLGKHLGDLQAHDDVSYLQLLCEDHSPDAQPQQSSSHSLQAADNWSLQLLLTAPQLQRLDLEPLISNFCQVLGLEDSRQGVFSLILRELLCNALDHGLLGLDSSLKREMDGFERYFQLRSERLQELHEGEIHLDISQHSDLGGNRLSIKVSDSGPGFDFHQLDPSSSQNDAVSYHGRGLMLLRQLCSHLEFLGNGNQVIAELRWNQQAAAGAA
jgi:DNA-binding response OmpR family regulator/anti-sigma regulatory factor (Ser/Thr protein kinase)